MNQVDEKYEALFTPWRIGNVEIKNRIVMCPMGGTSLFGWFELTGCGFDKEAAKLFLERANNNVGLIIPGIAPLRDTFWGKWLWQNPKMFEELKVFMDEIHKTGAKLFIQLTAGMGRSHPHGLPGPQPHCPGMAGGRRPGLFAGKAAPGIPSRGQPL